MGLKTTARLYSVNTEHSSVQNVWAPGRESTRCRARRARLLTRAAVVSSRCDTTPASAGQPFAERDRQSALFHLFGLQFSSAASAFGFYLKSFTKSLSHWRPELSAHHSRGFFNECNLRRFTLTQRRLLENPSNDIFAGLSTLKIVMNYTPGACDQ